MKPNPKSTLPDWLTGELLEAWNDYIKIRRKKKIVTDRIMNSRIKELTRFRELKLNLVEIIDSASEGNWRKFYPPKDFVMVEEKPVQERKKVIESDDIRGKRLALKKLYCDFRAINATSDIDRQAHQERIAKAKNDLDNAIKRGTCKKLGDIIKEKKT